jgi:hypothetical protein
MGISFKINECSLDELESPHIGRWLTLSMPEIEVFFFSEAPCSTKVSMSSFPEALKIVRQYSLGI